MESSVQTCNNRNDNVLSGPGTELAFLSLVRFTLSKTHCHVSQNWCLYRGTQKVAVRVNSRFFFAQAQVCEWLGEAYEDMTAHGVASYESKPDQSLLHDSALTDHSMQTNRTEESTGDPKGGSQSNGEVCVCKILLNKGMLARNADTSV